MIPLKLTTTKLFYKKYPYKVSCKIAGAYLLKRFKVEDILNSSEKFNEVILINQRWSTFNRISEFDLKTFTSDAIEFLENKDIKTRAESRTFDLYLPTYDLYYTAQNVLRKYLYSITEPSSEEELQTLLENTKYVLCKTLPKGKYRYKVIFKEMPANTKLNLINWAEKYNNDDIYISPRTQMHFKGYKNRWGTHFFYLKDSKMITLLAMAAGGYIRKTEEYIVRKNEEMA